jgi:hypothetical protein
MATIGTPIDFNPFADGAQPDDSPSAKPAVFQGSTVTVRPPAATAPAKLSFDDLVQRGIQLGYSPSGAAGVAQNVMRESGGNPMDTGDGGTSHGLFQHHNERWDQLQAFAKKQGLDPNSPDAQFAFADKELREQYPTLRKRLTDPNVPVTEAEDSFKRVFERPASIMWQGKPGGGPVLGNDKYGFSDYARREHDTDPGTDIVYMPPEDYLSLTPPLGKDAFQTPAGRSIQKSVARGDKVEEIPLLGLKVDGQSAQVTEQDGRHRALLAQQNGVDMIPVAIRKEGNGTPTEIIGTTGKVLPHNFTPAAQMQTQPGNGGSLMGRIGSAIGSALIPGAEAATVGSPVEGDPFAATSSARATVGAPVDYDPFAQAGAVGIGGAAATPDQDRPNMFMSAAGGMGQGFGNMVLGAQQLAGKVLEAGSREGTMGAQAGKWLEKNATQGVQKMQGEMAPADAAHPWAAEAGRMAGVVAPIIATAGGAAAPELSTGARIGMEALTGGAGAITQPVAGDDSFWGKKAAQAAFGTVGGVLLGEAFHALPKIIDPVINWAVGIKGPGVVKDAATKEIVRRIAQDAKAGGPTAQDMLDLLNTAPGKSQTLADVGGENLVGLAGKVAREPGEGRQIMAGFLNERDLNAGLRLSDDINAGIGKGSRFTAAKALSDSRAAAAEPAYDAAYQHPPIDPKIMQPAGEIGALLSRPSMRSGMSNALKIAAEEGRDPNMLRIVHNPDGLPEFTATPTWQTLDYVKRGLDDVVEGFRDPTSGRLNLNTYGRAADATRTEFRSALKALNPNYAKALEAYSGPSASLDAIKAGEGFLQRDPEEITSRLANLESGDKEFYKLGAASALRKAIAKTGAQGDEARKIVGNAYTRMQLRPLFDTEESFDNFISSVTAESNMFKTRFRVLGGSQTGARLAEDLSPLNEAALSAGKAALSASRQNPVGLVMHGVNALKSLKRAGDPALNASIARALTSPAANPSSAGAKLLKSLAAQKPTVPVNAMAKLTRPLGKTVAPIAGTGLGSMFSPSSKQQAPQ